MPRRETLLRRLGEAVDLLVIGGGITGAGIARDAARRGLRVALVEMGDIASGTSSRSSKLVHGGLRYLEHYQFSLVFEAVSERRILMEIAPHLVNPLGFLFPVYKGSPAKLWHVTAGMWLYDGLSLFRSPRIHRRLGRKAIAREEPTLRQTGLRGAPLYYDCSTDDARLTLETTLDAIRAGAVVATWSKATSLIAGDGGRVAGAIVEDTLTGGQREVHAHAVVNATGPWTDRTIGMTQALREGSGRRSSPPPSSRPLLRPTKGVHVVVAHERLPLNHAVVCQHPRDKRVLFAIPWGDRTYLGTTDTLYDGDPELVAASTEDVAYLLEASAFYFPDCLLRPDDVISTWAGLRPLIGPEDDAHPENDVSAVSREHKILVGHEGLITIAGGKLTTYRRMASEVVDTAVRLLELSNHIDRPLEPPNTEREVLPGARDWPADDDHDAVAAKIVEASNGKLTIATARLFGDSYGMLGLELARQCASKPELTMPLVAGRPEVLGQVDWAVEHELAATVSDVLVRRTQLFFRDWDQGLHAAPVVAARMGYLLGWDEARTDHELARYEREVALSRKWRSEEP